MIIHKDPSDIFGLSYLPRFDVTELNDADASSEYNQVLEQHGVVIYHGQNDEENKNILECIVLSKNPKTIFEIGIGANAHNTSTSRILRAKTKDAKYLGVDTKEKYSIFGDHSNTVFMQIESSEQTVIRNKLSELNMIPLDLIYIDGWHSINAFINDWKYVDLLSPNGIVVMHDISHHPGPRECFKAINSNLFDKFAFCPNDYGIGVAIKK
jgi:predicted O-methyltransferase YrrM